MYSAQIVGFLIEWVQEMWKISGNINYAYLRFYIFH